MGEIYEKIVFYKISSLWLDNEILKFCTVCRSSVLWQPSGATILNYYADFKIYFVVFLDVARAILNKLVAALVFKSTKISPVRYFFSQSSLVGTEVKNCKYTTDQKSRARPLEWVK